VVSRQVLRNKISRWLRNQHRRCWQDLGNFQRQARELIFGPCRGTRIRFITFSRIQSWVVTGLLTGHKTVRRHLHLMRLADSPLCRKCGAEDETSVHILCWCETLPQACAFRLLIPGAREYQVSKHGCHLGL
jgi:hypothetical protein